MYLADGAATFCLWPPQTPICCVGTQPIRKLFSDVISMVGLEYGSEEKGSSLCRCSILLGFFKSKKLERSPFELLSEDKITNLLGFLTK